MLWVDIDSLDEESAIDETVEALGLSGIDVDRLRADAGRARLTRTADRLHITLEAMEIDDGDTPRLVRREIDLVAAPNVVLTVHRGPVAALERFDDGLDGETRLGKLRAGDLMSSLIDEVLVGYFLLAESIERQIDELDQRALHSRDDDDILSAIVALRRRIGLVRRTLAPHRDALSTLALPEMDVEDTVGRPWPGLVDRLEAAMSSIENLREGLLGTFDIHMGRVSQRANDVMRTLTLLSAVLLPSVVLAGVMGMNFKVGFFEDATNFWFVVGGMLVLAVSIVVLAKARRWF
ncbi:MAG TPA: CorA family divalent cation transporter [Candidatus Limnocylindrales bacterium]|nr:CorA family divalent cation transporter [Candidatus Limnocylindrales bacterium]